MRRIPIAAAFCTFLGFLASTNISTAKTVAEQLMKMAPDTRVEQRCNGRASGIAVREHKLRGPEKVVAYAFADVKVSGTEVIARGAAIRDRGQWYHLSYVCHTSPDGLDIVDFQYELGAPVPREEWSTHYLVR